VSARRRGAQGRSLPSKLSASSPLVIAFNGEATSSIGAVGFTEATREVEVTIPAGNTTGVRRGAIAFGWPDGRTEERSISWEVRPLFKVSPPALVLHGDSMPAERRIVVWSDARPFRVINVEGPLISPGVDLPRQPGLRQELVLTLRSTNARAQQASDIEIQTDDPDQPTVTLTVLTVPQGKGTGP